MEAVDLGRINPREGHLPRPNWLFQGISLSVHSGDRFALVGPTGSGKTLLLRALAMLDPCESGRILWQGTPVSGSKVPGYRAEVMYVHQAAVLFPGTVAENFERPFTMHQHRHKQFSRDEVQRKLDSLGRGGLLAQPATSLSGGERQIIALLRAMQLGPSVLLLDEPTASLDVATAQSIEKIIIEWQAAQSERRAYLWVTHTPEQVARISNRVLKMDQGTLTQPLPTEVPRNA